jgi:protein-S-isoprenylcysteine O-methyltransferase Ste14
MAFTIWQYIEGVWILVGLIWAVGAFTASPARRRGNALGRLLHLGAMAAAFSLIFSDWTRVDGLGARPFPAVDWVGLVGFCITVAGCAFAVWARVLLGANWSAAITVKRDHALIRSGPYAIVRHPIYAGLLLAMFGTALALGEVRGFFALAFAFAGWTTKARTEEVFLIEEFGNDYIRYRRDVKRIIPLVL